MLQEIKFPNKYNPCASFCRKTDCVLFGNCVFGFNRIFGGARELRLDFNRCNLKCELCWSNNNDLSRFFSVEDVFENFAACISANYKYIHEIVKPQKADTFKLQSLHKKDVEEFYCKKSSHLEKTDLIESDLKSNSKTDYRKTKLKYLFDTDR